MLQKICWSVVIIVAGLWGIPSLLADTSPDHPLSELFTVSMKGYFAESHVGLFPSSTSDSFDLSGQIPNPLDTSIVQAYVIVGCQNTAAGTQIYLTFDGYNLGQTPPANEDSIATILYHSEYVWDVTDYVDPTRAIYPFVLTYGSGTTPFGAQLVVFYSDLNIDDAVKLSFNHGAELINNNVGGTNIGYTNFDDIYSGDAEFYVFVVADDVDSGDMERLIFDSSTLLGPSDIFNNNGGQKCTWIGNDLIVLSDGLKKGEVDPALDANGVVWLSALLISTVPTPTPTPTPTQTPSPTPTATPSPTPSPTPTSTYTPTVTPTSTPTTTPTQTPTPKPIPSISPKGVGLLLIMISTLILLLSNTSFTKPEKL